MSERARRLKRLMTAVPVFSLRTDSDVTCSDEFFLSSLADNKVHVWNLQQEKPILVLEGHTRTVNCVHWNPVVPTMLASVSDDYTVRIWGPRPPGRTGDFGKNDIL